MLQEPYLSQYDLQFKLFGFPVRIAWGFWALAAVLGFESVSYIDNIYYQHSDDGWTTPGTFALLVIHALALCLSILIHELGHTFLFRHYGMDSRIVLYHFGGLAIPGSFTDWNAARRRTTNQPQHLIAISAAGPILQLLVGIATWAAVTMFHINLSLTGMLEGWVELPLPEELAPARNAIVQVFFDTFVSTSVLWSLLNLLPIYPLDGGQITREVLRLNRVPQPLHRTAMISMVTAGLLMWYAMSTGRQGSGLMCLFLLSSNFQLYQQTRHGEY